LALHFFNTQGVFDLHKYAHGYIEDHSVEPAKQPKDVQTESNESNELDETEFRSSSRPAINRKKE